MEDFPRRSPARKALGLVVFCSVALAMAAGTTGCPKKPKPTPIPEETPTPATPVPTATQSLDDAMRNGVTDTTADLTGACGDSAVYFELDSSALTAESTNVVKSVVSCLSSNAGWKVTVEGHADERGGTQYNLALGERRARTVADYLKNAGVEGGRVTTVSFGEEKPADAAHTEASWAKNRRVEFRISK